MVNVHTLLAREKHGASTKSLLILSMPPYSEAEKRVIEPELYEIEIQQPPTREDWITGVREAVDACSFDEGHLVRSDRNTHTLNSTASNATGAA